MSFSQFTPAQLIRKPEPFDSDEYLFELKMDGFRALAHFGADGTRLVSRRGNTYKRFTGLCAAIQATLKCEAILDGEIVCLDAEGRSQFYELLWRRGHTQTIFYAFDLLALHGEDLRSRPLIERKKLLRAIIPERPSALLYASHIDGKGCEFYRLACERDLEGIVAKLTHGAYGQEWFKIRNPHYSQYEGRRELFEKKHAERARDTSKSERS